MGKPTPETRGLSTAPEWETLEARTRARIQEAIQAVLEAEVTELLGRAKSGIYTPIDKSPALRPRDS